MRAGRTQRARQRGSPGRSGSAWSVAPQAKEGERVRRAIQRNTGSELLFLFIQQRVGKGQRESHFAAASCYRAEVFLSRLFSGGPYGLWLDGLWLVSTDSSEGQLVSDLG